MAKKSKRNRETSKRKFHVKPSSELRYPMVPGFMEKWITDHRAGAAIAIVYGIVILMISLPNYQVGPYFDVVTDFYWDYVPSARDVQSGIIPIDDYRGPMYPIALALTGLIIPDLFTAGIVLACFSASFTLFFLFQIFKSLFRPDLALCAVLLVAINPVFVEYSYNPGTDMFFVALLAGVLYFLLQNDGSFRSLGIAALLAAMAYLTRYNGLFIIAAIPFIILVVNLFQTSWKQRIIKSVYFTGLFFLLITPWGLYCLNEKGDFFYNKNYRNIAYEVYAKGEMGWDEFWYGEGVDVESLGEVIFKDPARFFGNVLSNVPGHFISDMGWGDNESVRRANLVTWPVAYLTLIGLIVIALFIATGRYRPSGGVWAFYIYSALFFSLLLLVFHGPRFSIFMLPFYTVLGLQMLTLGKKPLERFTGLFRWVPVMVAVVLFVSFQETYEVNRDQMNTGTEHLLEVRKMFERALPEEERTGVISARQPHIAYVLGLDFRRMPHAQDYESVMVELRERNVNFLYYGLIEIQRWPQLRFLMDPNNAPPGLTPVVVLPQTGQRPQIVLYRIEY